MLTHRNSKGQSTDIVANVRPLDETRNSKKTARLATYRNPTSFLFKGEQSTAMTAWVCADCGYVEFYADDPKALKVGSA